jgi:hypothetical protein
MDYEKELLQEMSKSLERLDVSVDSINVTLAVQAEQLKHHIKRTELLEEEFKPVREHVTRVNALILLLGGILALLGTVKAIIEIVQLF